jgi:hypothetical protein
VAFLRHLRLNRKEHSRLVTLYSFMSQEPPQLPPYPYDPPETPDNPESPGPGQEPELPDPGEDMPTEMPPLEPDYPGMPPLTD